MSILNQPILLLHPDSSDAMWYGWLADLTLCLHAGFILFVMFGGFLTVKWPRAVWLHLPAVLWGATVEFTGWICPLTPLENWLREQAGQQGYREDSLSRYLLPTLYPNGLTRNIQLLLGAIVLAINISLYGWLWRRSRDNGRDGTLVKGNLTE